MFVQISIVIIITGICPSVSWPPSHHQQQQQDQLPRKERGLTANIGKAIEEYGGPLLAKLPNAAVEYGSPFLTSIPYAGPVISQICSAIVNLFNRWDSCKKIIN
jgi:hypothetical protein